ncbi:MAG: hypothetical protein H0V17_15970 [Deltaproteobacteria bacterium]|nr:hypothetical protein [Deltaproteobacteria bacterium]
MDITAHLDQSHLSLITRDGDAELRSIQEVVSRPVLVGGRSDLEETFGRLLRVDAVPTPKTLDLIGHSTPDRSLLILGDWVIDGTRSKVTSFFRGLADCEVFPRLGIHAIRLLGCHTAESEIGRHTLIVLADILEVEVFGTTQMIGVGSYDGAGFRADHAHVLVSATDLRRQPLFQMVKPGGEPYRRVLDVDSLPASPLGLYPAHPRLLPDLAAARSVLQLVRRGHGAQMPGLLTPSTCELALPSAKPGWFHRLQVLLDGEFVRVYPDGNDRPGVVFPVEDTRLLRLLLAALPKG